MARAFGTKIRTNSKVAGKDVVFEVKIDSIQQVTTPKLDKDFVKKNSEFKTVAE